MTLNEILWDRGVRRRAIGAQIWRGSGDLKHLRPQMEHLYGLGYVAFAYTQEWHYPHYDAVVYFKKRASRWDKGE